ncbi:hypothetical protein [Haloferax sp. DFSO60]|uniref:hypothetical protein n=1 Tax=Haloferax sp. DFSO60 TaxID=3388652 RepID=UPI0039795FA7
MNREAVVVLLAAVVGLSLVASPVLMHDWTERATFSTEPAAQSLLDGEIPIHQYDDLSQDAQRAVRKSIESPDGSHSIYGREDWPDDFEYATDTVDPGSGWYIADYQGAYYELKTWGDGGFWFVYWAYELPVMGYGFVLLWLTRRAYIGRYPARNMVALAALGVTFHLLGPEFDFPILAPMQLVGAWTVASVAIVLVAVREYTYTRPPVEA